MCAFMTTIQRIKHMDEISNHAWFYSFQLKFNSGIYQQHNLNKKMKFHTQPLHYAAKESNRELDKSLKVIALLLLIFGPNMIFFF